MTPISEKRRDNGWVRKLGHDIQWRIEEEAGIPEDAPQRAYVEAWDQVCDEVWGWLNSLVDTSAFTTPAEQREADPPKAVPDA